MPNSKPMMNDKLGDVTLQNQFTIVTGSDKTGYSYVHAKWCWMTDWCKRKGISPYHAPNWKSAETAWFNDRES